MIWLNSVGLIFSESAVDPRTSAKSIDISTSAPPGNSREACSHRLQKPGFRTERSLPNKPRTISPPTPRKGALQNLQRGSCGSKRKIRRRLLSTANALVVNQNHHTLPTSMDLLSLIFKADLRKLKNRHSIVTDVKWLPIIFHELLYNAESKVSHSGGRDHTYPFQFDRIDIEMIE